MTCEEVQYRDVFAGREAGYENGAVSMNDVTEKPWKGAELLGLIWAVPFVV